MMTINIRTITIFNNYCWNTCEFLLPFPFNVDFEEVYAQANLWNQHWGKERKATHIFVEPLSLSCVFRKCFSKLRLVLLHSRLLPLIFFFFVFASFIPSSKGPITVLEAILTSQQPHEKLLRLYDNLMSNNFCKTAVLKKIWIVN